MKAMRNFKHVLWYVLMIPFAILMIYPLVFSVLGGFNTKQEFSEMGELLPIPKNPTAFNFKFAMSATAIRPLINGLMRSIFYALIVTIMAILIGYVIARYDFKGKKALMAFIIIAQVIPGVLTMIPTFVMVSKIPFFGGNDMFGNGGHGLYNSKSMLFLPLSWNYLMWVFLFVQSMKGLTPSFEDAAEIDGCGFFKTLTQIIIPIQKPIVTVIFVNVALNVWNDWMTPFFYINDTKNTTLTAYIAVLTSALKKFGEKDYPKIFALATFAILPPFILFLIFQKNIVQGIASAGVKG